MVSKHISAKCLGEFKEIHISAKCLGEFKEIHISAKCLGEFKEIYNLKKIYKMIVLTLMRKVIYRKVNLGW